MPEYILGYVANQIIRKNAGSPGVSFVFSDKTESVMIDNLGSSNIYFKFDSQVVPSNSGTGIIGGNAFRVFDVECGSVFIQGSGVTGPEVQCVRLT